MQVQCDGEADQQEAEEDDVLRVEVAEGEGGVVGAAVHAGVRFDGPGRERKEIGF